MRKHNDPTVNLQSSKEPGNTAPSQLPLPISPQAALRYLIILNHWL